MEYFVMESKNDVIISKEWMVENNEKAGFKIVGSRKTMRGAERLAEKRCKL
ncbi:hypothetical protein NYE69_33390 [Paenibacillus sp. FSL R5-0527]|uniref:hypothetical protein n=1 Tax=Paenibacillus sp. FSL R5-0527 TaxID=2975321 RepID=UPI00268BD4D6